MAFPSANSSVLASESSLALSSLLLGSWSFIEGPDSCFSFPQSRFSSSSLFQSFSSITSLSSPVLPIALSNCSASSSPLSSASSSPESSLTLKVAASKSCSISIPLSFLPGNSCEGSCSSLSPEFPSS
uniref:Uncharacterized protein n=1 Tax=Opuntia streptacantha TaxID=393608 RepID=A0A7C8ZEL1_OPUST